MSQTLSPTLLTHPRTSPSKPAPQAAGSGMSREQSPGEELANSWSHGLGAVLAAIFLPQLISNASRAGTVHGIAAAVFGLSMILLYSISAAYHWLPQGAMKNLMRRLDHGAIFLFIAGSYTPFMLGSVADSGGLWLLVVVWTFAGIGTAAKCADRLKHPYVSTGLYLGLGWLSVFVLEPLIVKTPPTGVMLILGGGVLYTLGAIVFHFDEKIRYAHFVWHLLVLSASACHFLAVLHYAIV
ncbi:PAQR family membrane homeostasis protein TrhA [Ramlibacter sp.]|uniref:PAQR family membrane homeostasis protein TrhA n=1 Tax=Ramlibacter sp. TaxID=1917967 RepID=UPI003D0A36F6